MIGFLFFQPVVNGNAPVEPNTRVIRFDNDMALSTCVPTPLPPGQLPNNPNWWIDQMDQIDWEAMGISMEEWLDQFNLPEPLNLNAGTPQQKSVPKRKDELPGDLQEVQRMIAPWQPPCGYVNTRTFRAGEKYYAKQGLSALQNQLDPFKNNWWVIDVNGLRYETPILTSSVTDLGSAAQLRTRLQLVVLVVVLVVIAIIYRFFVK